MKHGGFGLALGKQIDMWTKVAKAANVNAE